MTVRAFAHGVSPFRAERERADRKPPLMARRDLAAQGSALRSRDISVAGDGSGYLLWIAGDNFVTSL
jgi:hypothetical protein